MPTLAPEPSSSGSAAAAHQQREMAQSFGVDPERYDRARPRYPRELVRRIVTASPGGEVLDVGCGTGTAARQFQEAGCAVLGVDPDQRMAEFARHGGLDVEVATFEAWNPAGRTFDAVVAGTAWHWIEPVAGAAKAARVLRPGGLLAPFWHVFQLPPELATEFAAAFRREVPDSPVDVSTLDQGLAAYEPLFGKVADAIREAGGFAPARQWRYDWERSYTRDEWLDQLPTTGILTRLPADRLARLLAAAGAAVDGMGGSFTMSYATVAVAAVRR